LYETFQRNSSKNREIKHFYYLGGPSPTIGWGQQEEEFLDFQPFGLAKKHSFFMKSISKFK